MTEVSIAPIPVEALPQVNHPGREAVIRNLLGFEYDEAVASGLVDMFYDGPEGNGLIHTLAGDIQTGDPALGENSGMIAQGFHHEPSAEYTWPSVIGEDGNAQLVTRVETAPVAEMSSKKAKEFAQHPFEPYVAPRTVINGLVKKAIQRDPQTGDIKVVDGKTTMYPKEYDPYAVLKTIQIAYNNRNPAEDVQSRNHTGKEVLINDSQVVLIDGQTPLTVRLIIDKASNKVMTAIPVIKKPGTMKLTDQQIQNYVYGDGGTIKS